jgi:hypothetical protein
MSRIRDIANILTAANSLATDTETAAAITSHNSATTSVHGIANTASLATQDFVLLNKGVPSGTTAQRPVNFLSSTGDVYSNTSTGYMEIYNSTYGWEKVGANPSNLVVTPTNVGTGRAFNNGAVEVDLGFPAVPGRTYTITSTPTTTTYTANTAYAIFDGLQSSTQYTFTATATNLYGSSTPVTSSPVTVTTVPQAPTIGTAVAGSNTVTVSWTPGATGGSAITGYSVYPLINGVAQNPTTVPNQTSAGISVTDGTAYTFKVAAINSNGMSQLSSASNSATPSSNITVDYLVVAGGGGGGAENGGGGGAGGLRSTVTATGRNATLESALQITPGSVYTINVGAGGPGALNSGVKGSNGVNSSISGSGITTVTSLGGGAGGSGGNGSQNNGTTGGCGGAARGNRSGAFNGLGTAGQGYDAGTTGDGLSSPGGGGAGSAGVNATNGSTPTSGGNGLAVSITGSSITYAGGGGGSWNSNGSSGGSGGGGNGASGQNAGGNGTDNLGGGGGGGGDSHEPDGGSGGSGVVILRALQAAVSTTGSPVATTSGSYYIYKFTGNGSITF